MLRFIYLNQKKLPVPVPIRTLKEAIDWAEESLISADRMITKMTLDGESFYDLGEAHKALDHKLSPDSKLCLIVDSARELSLQAIDTIRNLASILERNLKSVAVQMWQHAGDKRPAAFKELAEDLTLCLSLLDHLIGLLQDRDQPDMIKLTEELASAVDLLNGHLGSQNYKAAARQLLNIIEPQILVLSARLAALHRQFFDLRTQGETPQLKGSQFR